MRARALAITGLLIVTVVVVLPVLDNGYVYDDESVIVHGDKIHDPSNLGRLFLHNTYFAMAGYEGVRHRVDHYRPVPLVSFMWDAALSGREPWAYHLTNLVVHLLCTLLVYRFVRTVVPDAPWSAAFAATAWFALTPHPGSGHIFITARFDPFCALFCLSAVLIWRRGLGSSGASSLGYHALAALLYLLGLLSKEVAVMIVPALVLWPERERVAWLVRVQRVAGFVGAALVYFAVRAAVLGGLAAGERGQLLGAVKHLAPLELDGLVSALFPIRLHMRFMSHDYGRLGDGTLVALAILFLAGSAAVLVLWRRRPTLAWGLFWFASVLAPIAVITTMLWPGFGRYLYVPSAGLAVALASALGWLFERRPQLVKLAWVLIGCYLAVLAVNLRGWVLDHHDQERFYSAAILADPEVPHAYGWLGMWLKKVGRLSEAADPLAKAHQLAPDEPRYLQALLDVFVKSERVAEARAVAEEGVRRYAGPAAPFHLLLLHLDQTEDPEAACRHALECLRKDPTQAPCGRALTHLLTEHPLKREYRTIARRLLAAPRMSGVRKQVAPLLDSLP